MFKYKNTHASMFKYTHLNVQTHTHTHTHTHTPTHTYTHTYTHARNIVKYWSSAPSRYLLRGALRAGLYDVKCCYERVFSINYSKTKHSKLKPSPEAGNAHAWNQPRISVHWCFSLVGVPLSPQLSWTRSRRTCICAAYRSSCKTASSSGSTTYG